MQVPGNFFDVIIGVIEKETGGPNVGTELLRVALVDTNGVQQRSEVTRKRTSKRTKADKTNSPKAQRVHKAQFVETKRKESAEQADVIDVEFVDEKGEFHGGKE